MERAEVGIGVVEVEEIDRINILQASLAAMIAAVGKLSRVPALALIDGNIAPRLGCTRSASSMATPNRFRSPPHRSSPR